MHTWVDGRLLSDPATPVLRADVHGLTVGDGVFETVKVVDGRPFALTRHLARLQRSATGLGLGEVDLDAVQAGVAEVLAAEHLSLGRVRLTVAAGPGPIGSGRAEQQPVSLIVTALGMDPQPGATAVVSVPWRRNEHGATAGLKTTSYAENVLALAYAQQRGASEAMFANTAGDLCEGTGSNVFYVVDGELRTPTLRGGCLAGVTRALVLEWVGGREVDEPIRVAEQADEVFLVSTTRDVQAVRRWGARDLSAWSAAGSITQKAAAIFAERAADDLDP